TNHGRILAPGSPPRVPRGGVDHPWILRIEDQIGRADVRASIEYLPPGAAPVHRPKNPALRIRSVSMAECCHVDGIRILGMNQNTADLTRIAETGMCPRPTAVDRFVHAI